MPPLHQTVRAKTGTKPRRGGVSSPDQTKVRGANATPTVPPADVQSASQPAATRNDAKRRKAPQKVSEKGLDLDAMAARRSVQWSERPYISMPGKDPAHVARIAAAIRRMFAGVKRQPGDDALLDSVTSLHVRTEP